MHNVTGHDSKTRCKSNLYTSGGSIVKAPGTIATQALLYSRGFYYSISQALEHVLYF